MHCGGPKPKAIKPETAQLKPHEQGLIATADEFLSMEVDHGDRLGAEVYQMDQDAQLTEADHKVAKCRTCIDAMIEADCPQTAIDAQKAILKNLTKKAEVGSLQTQAGIHQAMVNRQVRFQQIAMLPKNASRPRPST